ncbi:ABC transporter substrate-binding protein [Chamaesiphon minutus]|uniref:Putative aliphatic sulfonates-binding protein n=1 Tax=Chamaesiphon minutus (strain ATCC 27169 / PCC 6605) TaxID=1173020 RepID=K9UGP9_CHAP6|nr:ABC transporter substrate-binding protein [Chamaesiphon minutus]AFY93379.1 ABC-type nitrate/sulfonate/bicarbonate transport system, periplasmic component [Chamaesiphon minutus PCC 6605]
MNIKRSPRRKFLFSISLFSLSLITACSTGVASNPVDTGSSSSGKKVIRIAIATQDQTINTATGGPIIREEKLLEKYLPKTGKYQNVEYKIEWSSHTSGPPINNKMLANQVDIGMMGDFPLTINMNTFKEKGAGVNSLYIATLSTGATGAGNAIMVPKDSPIQSIADLKGKQVSVPFGSAAHGMLLGALKKEGIDPETEIKLVSQAPEVGGTSLKTNKIDAHANFVPFGELFPLRGFARKIFDGAELGVPTFHGVVVRSDFAKENPEIVVAYLKALLEANKMVREQPEAMATKMEKWTSVEKEAVYMFLGPNGLQQVSPAILPVHRQALTNSVAMLKQLGKLDAKVNAEELTKLADDSYLKLAAKELGMDYDKMANKDEKSAITGADAATKQAIGDPKLAAQIWVKGEDKVRNFASIENMIADLKKLKAEGKQTGSTVFVHDRNRGWKLVADNSFFVRKGNNISAFLTEKAAKSYANSQAGSKVLAFKSL